MTFDPAPPLSAPVASGGADPRLRPLPGGTRPDHVTALLDALRVGLADVAPSATAPPVVLVPHAPGDDGAAVVEALRRRLRRPVPPGTAVILQTSGSTTGTGHLVALPTGSLTASARATEERLAGPGQWLLAVPAHHVAGLQVLVRSVVAGTTPVVLDTTAGFDPRALADAANAMRTDVPGYLSLVPTQLVRVLETGEEAVAPLRRLAAILVGGAATAPRALEQARARGLKVVTTYGMTETGGGCVYDGRPLPGVRLRLTGADDRVEITGPVLAAGYLDDPVADAESFRSEDGVRWLRTSDRAVIVPSAEAAPRISGPLHADGHPPTPGPRSGPLTARELGDDPPLRLRVLGRVDDLINTGGIKVSPGAVERILAGHPAVAEVAVVPVPDPEWGELVTAVVVAAPGEAAPELTPLRKLVSAELDGAHAPRALIELTELPLRGPGKVDRRTTAQLAARALQAPQTLQATKTVQAPEERAGTNPAGHATADEHQHEAAVVRTERYDGAAVPAER
ncbi:O-succinylbenzoic acid--CoA ligase [Georgenia soli]|uniref:O-succinylbenzoic acid--CoA ligase n=1 Tax=Georgenia soli TaxID=638953 RepID=A0A2A9ENJ3_9MICO|nr:AMP-binding protein [Georgenia soli]PFG40353.1 O-succinylbenzoic acid--CoA ligase [Georgenia soli]